MFLLGLQFNGEMGGKEVYCVDISEGSCFGYVDFIATVVVPRWAHTWAHAGVRREDEGIFTYLVKISRMEQVESKLFYKNIKIK